MSDDEPLSYTRIEIDSYLPTGWSLAEPEGTWDARKRVWRIRLRDGVDFEWPLAVAASAARAKGRLEALRAAIRQLYLDRLGKPTRGLGVG